MTITFDPVRYKDTTRAQWEDAAAAWHAWGPTLEEWLGEATTLLFDAAGVTTGSRVLDVAAGAGGQSIAAAQRVGDAGAVLATDISPAILDYAAAAATAAGLTNVRTRELDGERLDVDAAAFDAVISRLGLIYFPDQPGALAGQYRALRPGGPDLRDRLLDGGPQRVLLSTGIDHPSPGPAPPTGPRPARAVQSRRSRRPRGRLPAGWLPRRGVTGDTRSVAPATCCGLRPVRA